MSSKETVHCLHFSRVLLRDCTHSLRCTHVLIFLLFPPNEVFFKTSKFILFFSSLLFHLKFSCDIFIYFGDHPLQQNHFEINVYISSSCRRYLLLLTSLFVLFFVGYRQIVIIVYNNEFLIHIYVHIMPWNKQTYICKDSKLRWTFFYTIL